MQKIILPLVLLFTGFAAFAAEIDYKLYMRAPAGTNSEGGKQYTLTNPGSHGNEFRLGNETAYAEAYFTTHVLKGANPHAPYFDANLTFAYNPQMNSQYGDTTTNTDYIQVIQAFVKGGNVDGVNISWWAGKRFYRDVDLHMDDFYYFADMSGVGAGAEDINVGNGTVAVALLQHSDNSLQKTTNGVPSKQALDLRWHDLKIGREDSLHLWLAGAYAPPGTGFKQAGTPPSGAYNVAVDYEAATGVAAGVRWQHDLSDKSFNNLAVMYGTGMMENFNMDNSLAYAQTGTNVKKRKRTRIVENPVLELSDKWSVAFGLIYEDADSGAAQASHSRWYSAGVRPIYYFTEHYHLAMEAGFSSVKVDSETSGSGSAAGERTLTRLTIAPELALGKGFFSRPVIRAYGTYSSWNKANADQTNSSSLAGSLNSQNIMALNGRRDETQFGFEAEVWF